MAGRLVAGLFRPQDLIHSRKWRRICRVPAGFETVLRGAGLRVTRPRLAVLGAVHRFPHADTDVIFSAVRAELGDVSQQAVYDVLHALTAARLVRRLEPMGMVARYEARVGDHHHHLVCRDCGDIVDVDHAAGDTSCLTPAGGSGYEVDEAEVIFWGRCARCVTPSPGRATADQRRLDRADPHHKTGKD
jgi:Fur family ferric uptake transcriptional regulator